MQGRIFSFLAVLIHRVAAQSKTKFPHLRSLKLGGATWGNDAPTLVHFLCGSSISRVCAGEYFHDRRVAMNENIAPKRGLVWVVMNANAIPGDVARRHAIR